MNTPRPQNATAAAPAPRQNDDRRRQATNPAGIEPYGATAPASHSSSPPRRPVGRPRRFEDALTNKMWFRLTEAEYDRVRAVAALNRQPLADFVRDAVVDAADRE